MEPTYLASCLSDETLDQFAVRMDGVILDPDGDVTTVDEIEQAVTDLTAELNNWLARIKKAHAVVTG